VARVAKEEPRLSHPYYAQALDDHLVDSGDDRRVFYDPLNRLTNHSKNPGLFGVWTFACTGLAFFFGVGDGVNGGDRVNVTVGGDILVGNHIGVLDGIFVGGGALNTVFLYSINRFRFELSSQTNQRSTKNPGIS
jgi:hypothetical protein